jgi:hypothetical protein
MCRNGGLEPVVRAIRDGAASIATQGNGPKNLELSSRFSERMQGLEHQKRRAS